MHRVYITAKKNMQNNVNHHNFHVVDPELKIELKMIPPQNFTELQQRLNDILGLDLSELATRAGAELPQQILHDKGFAGKLLETILGTSGGNTPGPDFPGLGVELKTMPVDENFRPLESTFICHAFLNAGRPRFFLQSLLYKKICRVLFVMIKAPRDLPPPKRFIAGYSFWQPSAYSLELIRTDYEELMEMVASGQIDSVNATIGTVIQMRPKAADGSALTEAPGPEGTLILTRPRGFYMRRSFTTALLQQFLGQPREPGSPVL